MEYYKVYIQKEGGALKETIADFGLYCQTIPFHVGRSIKELPKRSWFDEHGDDEYVPDTLMVDAYDLDVTFIYKGSKYSANTIVSAFISYITGADNSGTVFSIYDSYTGIGRQKCRVMEVAEKAQIYRVDDSEMAGEGDILQFSVKVKVNDPVTNWVPNLS